MNYEEELSYREQILNRVYKREKITTEERLWLSTHRAINRVLGYPYLNYDIIQLNTTEKLKVQISIETRLYDRHIIPVITVPGQKGYINADNVIVKDRLVPKKKIKMLGLMSDLNEASVLEYQSDLGLMEISYECDYYDDKQHLIMRKISSTGWPSFALVREDISDNIIRFKCKSPTDNNFDSLVFTVEWQEL